MGGRKSAEQAARGDVPEFGGFVLAGGEQGAAPAVGADAVYHGRVHLGVQGEYWLGGLGEGEEGEEE